MSITYGHMSILLQGILPHDADCSVAQLFSISSAHSDSDKRDCIPQVQILLDEYSQRFAEPSSLPPHHDCDHKIPLV